MGITKYIKRFLNIFGVHEEDVPTCIYGCPHAEFVVRGTVSNEAGDLISGATVTAVLNSETDEEGFHLASAQSNEMGEYEISHSESIDGTVSLQTTKEGYAANTTGFEVKTEDFVGGDGVFDQGSCIVNQNITLKESEDQGEIV